jgi:hypothetical protein
VLIIFSTLKIKGRCPLHIVIMRLAYDATESVPLLLKNYCLACKPPYFSKKLL